MRANFHKPSGLQIYCYSSLANRQINLIRAQPSRENFEGSRVQSRHAWAQLTRELPLGGIFSLLRGLNSRYVGNLCSSRCHRASSLQ